MALDTYTMSAQRLPPCMIRGHNGPLWLRPVTSFYLAIDNISSRRGEQPIVYESSEYIES